MKTFIAPYGFRLFRFAVFWVVVLALLGAGCASYGSGTIGRDQMDSLYCRQWFWVDDLDYPSKQIFSFLLILSSLNAVDTRARGRPS